MNNARYFDYIDEVLPENYEVSQFECAYKKQVKYLEKIKVSFGENFARIKNEMGDTCFFVKFN